MNPVALVLCLCALTLLGSLPLTFFRPGRLTVGWALTAAPFILDAALVIAALAGRLASAPLPDAYAAALAIAAVPLLTAGIALTCTAVGVHRVPVSLWHQENDTPDRIVTWGPYASVRHPFYASFILMLAGIAAALPHIATITLFAVGALQLHYTARKEERRLLASPLGPHYAGYMTRTGRLLPRPRQPGVRPHFPIERADSTTESSSPAATRAADPSGA